MELVLIRADSEEWKFMWTWLENHPLNKGLEDPSLALNGNHGWRYMGSFKHKDRVLHSFRHLDHPVTQSIQSISVQNSTGFTSDQIHNEYKL